MSFFPATLYRSELPSLNLSARGKVRDLYTIDEERLLIVATDRLSAFDVVLPTPIPDKGRILTQLSRFWFEKTAALVPNHLLNHPLESFLEADMAKDLSQRSLVTRKLTPLPLEAIVRGYLIGSGWKDYQATGKICGNTLPSGLHLADALPKHIYTPSSKAPQGQHDQNIDFDASVQLVGPALAEQVRDISLRIYAMAADYALQHGILIADTKFEFGLDSQGTLYLIDEVLTPDSSRFWPADNYRPGSNPASFDKQFIRDYLSHLDWTPEAPPPKLPEKIVIQTMRRYQEAEQRLLPPHRQNPNPRT